MYLKTEYTDLQISCFTDSRKQKTYQMLRDFIIS